MAQSPNTSSDGTLRFTIYSEGEAVNATYQLESAFVHKEVNRIGKALLVFVAGNMPEGEVPESDMDTFAPGKQIRVEMGYGEEEHPVFDGIVTAHNFIVHEGNAATLQIECRDHAYATTRNRKSSVFENQKDSDAMAGILKGYSGLEVTVDDTAVQHQALMQYYCSDWDFVLSRADANGLVVITEGNNMSIRPPKVSGEADLRLTYGVDILTFAGELKVADQLDAVYAQGWDPANQAIVDVQSSPPTLNDQGNGTQQALANAVANEGRRLQTFMADKALLKSWADGQQLKAGLSRIKGTCTFAGNAKAIPGNLMELVGLGERFNGHAYIGYVEHELDMEGWKTTVGMGLSSENVTAMQDVVAPLAAGFVPGINGLHIGKVHKLAEDPTGGHQLQIELPLLHANKQLVWARLLQFWASSGYGTFFIPDVGDEVIVGFLNADPNHAVILGSVYSAKQAPPYPLSDQNTIRAIFTKSNMKIEFEEERKEITIQTPGKNTIVISDEDKSIRLSDQHNNKIAMTSDGISMESSASIQLKAKADITLEANGAISASAKGNMAIKGTNIDAQANASLTVKGNAKAEISAAGQTIVKGAMVMIN